MDPISWFVVVLVLLVVALLGYVAGIALGVQRHLQQRWREDTEEWRS